jgi:chromosomal replication initiation ATPase DnaA
MDDMDNISYWVFPGISHLPPATLTLLRLPSKGGETPYEGLDVILGRAAQCFGVSVADIVSRTRKLDITLARHAYCLAAMTLTGATLVRIGGEINRHHASVINSVKSSRNMINTGFGDFEKKFKQLKEILQ